VTGAVLDPVDVRRAHTASGLLRTFNDAGVLSAADVHVAQRLCAVVKEHDERVALAAALAVRGPRLGHVCVDVATLRASVAVDAEETVDVSALPWPETAPWLDALAASPAVGTDRPLRLEGTTLYLDRYLHEERAVAGDLLRLAATPAPGVRLDLLHDGLARLFPREQLAGRQALAAAAAVVRRFAVVAGGPGTGKTTTVARIVALLAEQAAAAGEPLPLVALAAPTGKAAARLHESVREEAARLDVAEDVRDHLLSLDASTLHRLLGRRPGSTSRFRHHRGNRLPHQVVVVDETSMVSLSLMARLVEAVRPDARLILVGDPGQLTSIEAGAVLGDVVGPAADGLRMSGETREALSVATGAPVEAADPPAASRTDETDARPADPPAASRTDDDTAARPAAPPGASRTDDDTAARPAAPPGASRTDDDTAARPAAPPGASGIGDGIVFLTRVHRYEGDIAALAEAIRRGDADAALAVLGRDSGQIAWLAVDTADRAARETLAPVREGVVTAARTVIEAARAGDARTALHALGTFRVLCAHRRGPAGVTAWTAQIERWLGEAIPGFAQGGRWYPGRPLLVTENDYALQLFNGDTGVVVTTPGGGAAAAFERRGETVLLRPSRLGAVETVHAMTIHKSQGSQFDTAAVLLPDAASALLTRELLYTAVTRARTRLVVAGDEPVLRAAIARPVARASGLSRRLG